MPRLSELASHDREDHLRVVIETPRGSRLKIKYEPELEAFLYGRPLPMGLAYPYDWGFVPGTKGPDGDPVDALVMFDAPTYPGIIIPCRPLAVLRVEQKGDEGGRVRNDRIICIPLRPPAGQVIEDRLPGRLERELEAFFMSAVQFEDKEAEVKGWGDAAEAEALVRRCKAS